jgi:hypothetical protein
MAEAQSSRRNAVRAAVVFTMPDTKKEESSYFQFRNKLVQAEETFPTCEE